MIKIIAWCLGVLNLQGVFQKIVSSGWSFVFALDSARSYVLQVVDTVYRLFLVVGLLFFAVLVILVVVVAIVRVVIVVVIIGIVVVVGGVSFILELSFVIIGNPSMKTSMSFSEFGTMFGHKSANSWNLLISRAILIGQEPFQFSPSDLVDLLYSNRFGIGIPPGQGILNESTSSKFDFAVLGTDATRKYQFSSFKPMNEINSSFCTIEVERLAAHKLLSGGGVVDLTRDKDPTDEDGDIGIGDSIGVSMSLGEIFSKGKKSRELNIGDSDNTRDGDTIFGEKTSVAKRYLVKSFEESGKVFPGKQGGDVACLVTKRWKGGACKLLCMVVVMSYRWWGAWLGFKMGKMVGNGSWVEVVHEVNEVFEAEEDIDYEDIDSGTGSDNEVVRKKAIRQLGKINKVAFCKI
uniref:Uncharacterized protein n=1 Tax=Tanacetum cinerariifolium TaxID=118510 RepID=A0A6L2NFL2_TANCI|nr:hypothetical protein [Tanacetum cinerariifolium]